MLDFDPTRTRPIPAMSTNCLLFPCLLFLSAGVAEAAKQPLFADDELLEVTITAPLSTIMAERPTDEELPGTFSYVNAAGSEVSMDIDIRTRGRYRQQARVCPFAPLRLD